MELICEWAIYCNPKLAIGHLPKLWNLVDYLSLLADIFKLSTTYAKMHIVDLDCQRHCHLNCDITFCFVNCPSLFNDDLLWWWPLSITLTYWKTPYDLFFAEVLYRDCRMLAKSLGVINLSLHMLIAFCLHCLGLNIRNDLVNCNNNKGWTAQREHQFGTMHTDCLCSRQCSTQEWSNQL